MCLDSDCADGQVGRRDFVLGSAAALAGLGSMTMEGRAQEKNHPPTRVLDDPRIQHQKVYLKSGDKQIDGYLARPKAEGRFPAVLVIAGNLITEDYIPNTCAALALAGFVGLVPNNYHAVPETAKTVAEINKALANWTDADYLRDIQAALEYLRAASFVNTSHIGILGYCAGGRRALLLADQSKEIKAVVASHPGPMKPNEVTHVKVPVQIHHGTVDRSVSHTKSQELEKALREQSTPVELFLYDKLDHGFLAYTRPTYNPDGAKLAWDRTVKFLDKHLKK